MTSFPPPAKPISATAYSRDIVNVANCNACHDKLGGIPGRQLGGSGASSTAAAATKPATAWSATPSSASTAAPKTQFEADGRTYTRPSTYRIDDIAIGNFPRQIHKIHMGNESVQDRLQLRRRPVQRSDLSRRTTGTATKCHDARPASRTRPRTATTGRDVPAASPAAPAMTASTSSPARALPDGSDVPRPRRRRAGRRSASARCATARTTIDKVYHLPVTPPNTGSALHVERRQRQHQRGLDCLQHRTACRQARSRSPTTSRACRAMRARSR